MEEWKKKTTVLSQRTEGISKFCFCWKFCLTRENVTFLTFFPSWPVFKIVLPGLTDFTGFRVLTPILHVLCVLTCKIERFYELKRIFNNHGWEYKKLINHQLLLAGFASFRGHVFQRKLKASCLLRESMILSSNPYSLKTRRLYHFSFFFFFFV